MKKQTRFIIEQAAMMDPTAVLIFTLTRRFFNLVLLVSLVLLAAVPFSGEPLLLEHLASALFHVTFRMATVGAVTGFIADIVLRRGR